MFSDDPPSATWSGRDSGWGLTYTLARIPDFGSRSVTDACMSDTTNSVEPSADNWRHYARNV